MSHNPNHAQPTAILSNISGMLNIHAVMRGDVRAILMHPPCCETYLAFGTLEKWSPYLKEFAYHEDPNMQLKALAWAYCITWTTFAPPDELGEIIRHGFCGTDMKQTARRAFKWLSYATVGIIFSDSDKKLWEKYARTFLRMFEDGVPPEWLAEHSHRYFRSELVTITARHSAQGAVND